jgi:hypothetical protein
MTSESALVVLRPGGSPVSTRDWERPPEAADAERVMAWFREHGFETGPFVGISFAITGPPELFREQLGEAVPDDTGATAYVAEALEPDLSGLVDAIVVQAPPDFGPGNP